MEHEEQAQRLEHEFDDLEERSERVGERIKETRDDWESKEQDPAVPGAQPDPDQQTEEESSVTETPPQESDQLPEEGPGEQVPDDGGSARDEGKESPGTPGDEGTATGNPDAAGSDEPDSDD
jgi:hypothetical protein